MSWHAVDWSQAPAWAERWAFYHSTSYGEFALWEAGEEGNRTLQFAPTFNYTGHPRDSLTLRPQKEAAG